MVPTPQAFLQYGFPWTCILESWFLEWLHWFKKSINQSKEWIGICNISALYAWSKLSETIIRLNFARCHAGEVKRSGLLVMPANSEVEEWEMKAHGQGHPRPEASCFHTSSFPFLHSVFQKYETNSEEKQREPLTHPRAWRSHDNPALARRN